MTKTEVSEHYNIPEEVLDEYERWGLCDEVKYDDIDIKRLSMIMTLHDIGFDKDEIETYMRLMLEEDSSEEQRLKMLNAKRSDTLEDIHFKERQLDRLDYLRFKMKR